MSDDDLGTVITKTAGLLLRHDPESTSESDLDPDQESCEEINCQAAHQASAHRRVLLITTVDIGGGVFEQIEIMEEDDPLDVTMQFCEDHSLPGSVLELLTEHILQTLQDTEMPPSPGWHETQADASEDTSLLTDPPDLHQLDQDLDSTPRSPGTAFSPQRRRDAKTPASAALRPPRTPVPPIWDGNTRQSLISLPDALKAEANDMLHTMKGKKGVKPDATAPRPTHSPSRYAEAAANLIGSLNLDGGASQLVLQGEIADADAALERAGLEAVRKSKALTQTVSGALLPPAPKTMIGKRGKGAKKQAFVSDVPIVAAARIELRVRQAEAKAAVRMGAASKAHGSSRKYPPLATPASKPWGSNRVKVLPPADIIEAFGETGDSATATPAKVLVSSSARAHTNTPAPASLLLSRQRQGVAAPRFARRGTTSTNGGSAPASFPKLAQVTQPALEGDVGQEKPLSALFSPAAAAAAEAAVTAASPEVSGPHAVASTDPLAYTSPDSSGASHITHGSHLPITGADPQPRTAAAFPVQELLHAHGPGLPENQRTRESRRRPPLIPTKGAPPPSNPQRVAAPPDFNPNSSYRLAGTSPVSVTPPAGPLTHNHHHRDGRDGQDVEESVGSTAQSALHARSQGQLMLTPIPAAVGHLEGHDHLPPTPSTACSTAGAGVQMSDMEASELKMLRRVVTIGAQLLLRGHHEELASVLQVRVPAGIPRSPAMVGPPAEQQPVYLGNHVKIGDEMKGVVCYIGPVHWSKYLNWLGVRLLPQEGISNGTVDGVCYFTCPPTCGRFVRSELADKILQPTGSAVPSDAGQARRTSNDTGSDQVAS